MGPAILPEKNRSAAEACGDMEEMIVESYLAYALK